VRSISSRRAAGSASAILAIADRACLPRAGPRLHFVHGEHDRRKIETRPQPVSDASLSLHRNAGNTQIANVPVYRSLGNLQPSGKLRGGSQAPPSQVLDDLEEPVGAPHLNPY